MVSKNWKRLSQKTAFKNKYFEVSEDVVEMPNGEKATFYVRRKKPFSVIIPFDGEKYHLVSQFRYHIEDISLEFPMGFAEGKDPYETAVLELEEEMGMTGDLKEIGWYWLSPGITDQRCYMYLATNLQQGKPRPEKGEFFEYSQHTLEEINELIINGTIKDGPTIVTFHFLKNYLNKHE